MRIAIDYTPAVRQAAGIGRLTRGLVHEVVRIGGEHSYCLFVADSHAPASRLVAWPPNVRLAAAGIPARLLTILWHRARLPIAVEHFVGRSDVFHATDFALPPVAHAWTVVTVHDLSFLRFPECADPRLRAYLSHVVPRSLGRADVVLADSEATRQDVIELLRVDSAKVIVLYGGIDAHFTPTSDAGADAQVLRKYGLDRPYVLSVGTLEPRKNYAALVRAFQRVRASLGCAYDLVIAGGRGWLWDQTWAASLRLQAEGHVRFLGFVPDEDLPAVYRGAELFAFASLYEGFGFPPLEAMACGCPVVCSDASSLPEVVGDAAILVDAGCEESLMDGLRRGLQDEAQRREMIPRGLARASRFTWPAAARRLLQVYEQT